MSFSLSSLIKPAEVAILFIACSGPLAWLIYGISADQLGANPSEYIIRYTGLWALRLLCITLAITPLRTILSQPQLARHRRMLGLFTYFYAALHLLAYSGLDMGFNGADIAQDTAKRPFILVGFSAFVLLTLLALTSHHRAIKMLGGPRWQMLHRAVYAIAVLAILHFFWMRAGKQDFAAVAAYGLVLGALLLWRIGKRIEKFLQRKRKP